MILEASRSGEMAEVRGGRAERGKESFGGEILGPFGNAQLRPIPALPPLRSSDGAFGSWIRSGQT
jgi:hypothetical protein